MAISSITVGPVIQPPILLHPLLHVHLETFDLTDEADLKSLDPLILSKKFHLKR